MKTRTPSTWREIKAVASLGGRVVDLHCVRLAELRLFPRVPVPAYFQVHTGHSDISQEIMEVDAKQQHIL